MNPEKIAFLVDSCAELEPRHRKGLPVYVVPLRIACKDKDYSDGEDIFAKDIYKRLERGELPKTSLPDMMRVDRTLENIRKDGYEKVVVLPLSSGLSGTHNMFRLACEEREDLETAVFQTYSGAIPIGGVVLQLWEDIQRGMKWEQLVGQRVEHLLRNTHAFFSVDTLEYLQKGGRIGKITALAGTVLNIKPILTFAEDGQLVNVAKVRGRKASIAALAEKLDELAEDTDTVFISHGDCEEDAKTLESMIRQKHPVKTCVINYVGPVIGSHSGPGTLALFFLGKHK